MAQRKLECVEVFQIKEAVQKFDIYGDKIIVLTHKNVLKVHISHLLPVLSGIISTNGMYSNNFAFLFTFTVLLFSKKHPNILQEQACKISSSFSGQSLPRLRRLEYTG